MNTGSLSLFSSDEFTCELRSSRSPNWRSQFFCNDMVSTQVREREREREEEKKEKQLVKSKFEDK